ncbi:4a-hydroxytetrahydrobiopterin dehydratase [Verrucomicrobiota bacterium]
MSEHCSLTDKSCRPCEGSIPPLGDAKVEELFTELKGWELISKELVKTFTFKNFYETIAFTNAVAWIANSEDHHPDLEISYKTCTVHYSTHAINGLSENDFICAAKIDALIPAKPDSGAMCRPA